ncbi:MAG: hypothetical protein K6G52_00375, partial [Treponemataceae bacterium]|nr:hypothetical protein [Treponemataceae bacterium]
TDDNPLVYYLTYTASGANSSTTVSSESCSAYTDGTSTDGIFWDSTNTAFVLAGDGCAALAASGTMTYTIKVDDYLGLTTDTSTITVEMENEDTTSPFGQLWPLNTTAYQAFSSFGTDQDDDDDVDEDDWYAYANSSLNTGTYDSTLGHIEPREAISSSIVNPTLSGQVYLRGEVFDNQRIGSIQLVFYKSDETDSYTATVATWDSTTKALVASSSTTTGETAELHQYQSQEGHYAEFAYLWDTSSITEIADGVADSGIIVKLVVTDGASLTATEIDYSSTENSRIAKASRFTSSAWTGYNSTSVNIAPYVTSITTSLSSLSSRYPTAYSRTALGHYPVSSDETFVLYGYNLTGGAITNATVSANSDDSSALDVTPTDSLSSGSIVVTVNGVSSINNLNDNDLAVNQLGNGYNNDLLTDDLVIDIWEFDNTHIVPISGKIEQPVMKINPNSDKVGFAFVNGPLYFSMGGGTGSQDYSYTYWMGSYDFFTSVGFTYDKLGYSYGCAAGGDINSSSADKFQLMTSRWGLAGTGQSGSYGNTNSLRLESIGQKGDSDGNNTDTRYFDKQRFQSTTLATAVHDSTTNLYMAYYDQMNDEIRFRYGATSSTSKAAFGAFKDTETSGDAYTYAAGASKVVQMVAGSETGRNAGAYVSIGVVSEQDTTVDDVVVMVWYDATNTTLWYSYNDTPTTSRLGDKTATGWSDAVRVFSANSDMAKSGEYCKVAVDVDGGVHIACYDPINLDLNYAYLPASKGGVATAQTDFSTCVVDSNGVTGSNLTLDVAKVDGNWIPYIGYYMTSCTKPKLAYKVDTENYAPDGSDDDMFTGDWEITIVPTEETVEMQSNQHNDINVGVWKDSDTGVMKTSLTTTSSSNSNYNDANAYNSTSYGQIYGNGATDSDGNLYPIIGYAVKNGSSGDVIETAQKR